ncbi:PepSY-associated TM helix domain-containing protein [Rugamonas rubra]|uniref:Uncharacterized iron-regulated membrane protein n=1 Tax=Rugamonas rubra TaxID=758825 RepID=A0A1I4LG94_9BURK|nr:PepSY domain-containing protein [Rugamonas rubra]SFL90098.1 Uncharacterized iron-regulated membrane protein [Rugamonas rubra]
MAPATPSAAPAPRPVDLYRAVWRWHFYAGLLVLPFLVLLAVTGALYLFQAEIDDYVYRDLRTVPRAAAQLPHSAVLARAGAAFPGVVASYVPAAAPGRSAQVLLRGADGARVVVFVDPYRGKVLGSLPDKGGVSGVVRRLHSLSYFGTLANGLIEMAAGWTILLVVSGLYLWWPRGRRGALLLRGRPGQRVFWRDLHAVTGVYVALFLLFLAVTGMPWSVLWGAQINQWANGSNFGYPAGVRVALPMSDEHLQHALPTAWSLRQARLPATPTGAGAAAPIGVDRAVARFDQLGIARGYAVSLPAGPAGVYSAAVYPADLAAQRVVHIDQYTGRVLLDMGYGDYGPLGKSLEWGINVHLGQQFGLANQLVLLAACVAIVLLCVAGGCMWWQRRPAGGLGVPPMPADRGALKVVLAVMAVGGLLLPLVGASMLLMLALDYCLALRRR